MDIIDAYRCLECDHVGEEAGGPLYECCQVFSRETSADGEGNRCPVCSRFGSKIADASCVSCEEGEVEEVQAVEIDGELVALEGGGDVEELVSRALSKKEEERCRERELEEHRLREKQRVSDEVNALPRVRADEVLPGDLLVYHDPDSTWNEYPEHLVGRVSVLDDGRVELAPPGGIGIVFRCDPQHPFALKERPEITPENEMSLVERMRRAFSGESSGDDDPSGH